MVYSIILKNHENFKKHPIRYLHTSDGREIVYKFQKHVYTVEYKEAIVTPGGTQIGNSKDKIECHYLKEVKKPDAPDEKYEYVKRSSDNLLQIAYKKLLESRYLNIRYYAKGDNLFEEPIGNVRLDKNDYRIDRVQMEMAPVGEDNKAIPIYRFDYHGKIKKHDKAEEVLNGRTDVYDAYWHKTSYSYDKDHRLTKILRYNGTRQTGGYAKHSCERFFGVNLQTTKT